MASPIQDLIARKNYPKALDAIKAELQRRPKDVRLRIQQADVLIMAARNKEAIPVLMSLADEHASDGFTAKAIAFLKRIEKLESGRQDVEDRLARLVQEKVNQAAPVSRAPSAPTFGFEEFDSSQEITLGSSEPVSAAATTSDDMDGLDAINIEAPSARAATSATQQAKSFLTTPLFEGFSQEELAAIIRGLQFIGFEPGDILVGEGAPGDSMFIIASGTAKAYVRNMKGGFMRIKELSEGDFFGEVSVLTGKPRTATITAATEVEVLELDKATLDGITKKYPRVRKVLEDFQKKRAQETVEAIIRSRAD